MARFVVVCSNREDITVHTFSELRDAIHAMDDYLGNAQILNVIPNVNAFQDSDIIKGRPFHVVDVYAKTPDSTRDVSIIHTCSISSCKLTFKRSFIDQHLALINIEKTKRSQFRTGHSPDIKDHKNCVKIYI